MILGNNAQINVSLNGTKQLGGISLDKNKELNNISVDSKNLVTGASITDAKKLDVDLKNTSICVDIRGNSCRVLYNSTANWNRNPTLIAKKGYIYIYSDYSHVDDQDIPGFKVGDGKAYLIDLPFITNDNRVLCDTTNGWNSQPSLIGERGYIYIYSDTDPSTGITSSMFKIGTGG